METFDVDPEGVSIKGLLGAKWTRYDNMVKCLNMTKHINYFSTILMKVDDIDES